MARTFPEQEHHHCGHDNFGQGIFSSLTQIGEQGVHPLKHIGEMLFDGLINLMDDLFGIRFLS